ncbi:D-alanyl-D-alanine carboxypeptidase/D-alanyl-D-alanine endopeptidase [Candidatus Solirubrobacter pratensis]|uniref:D-alanyl-D-alanine carboxypeptidase/D-alanyl-D-alanine endopeptidase n=1 Tax=Candidatus Solirubrobacter pratensis TaxID=1298857 RepID=UPI0003F6659F|nr:D-alanyl-D-alanine carboxypeptidase/D-alanyl-D-alanine-endopeptidase [Candidatus Solirubrobacter pratensis]
MKRLVLALTILLLLAPSADAATLATTQRVLAREMAKAGGASGAYVLDAGTGEELYSSNADVARMPASVEKLYTSSAALLLYGASGRLSTTVLSASLPDDAGDIHGDVVLRGGGDPTFDTKDLSALAGQLTRAGLDRIDGRVIGDESAFDAFRGPPSSAFRLSSDVGPLSALSYDHGRTGKRRPYWQSSPARFAAQEFAKALEKRGVKITGAARSGLAPTGMTPLRHWDSPTVADIVKAMNQPSDNYMAETLIKAIGADHGTAGSTVAGADAIENTVARFKIAPQIQDGSGLSRNDRTTPRQVVQLLSGMAGTEQASAFDASLPVVGRNGTLYRRMRGTAAQDRCHAKTGTLHDVSTLAGYCTTLGGRRVAFAFLMNATSTWRAHPLQDAMTVALARLD